MYHFFVPPQQVEKPWIHIAGSDVNHIKNVLRMRIGEQVKVSDSTGTCYLTEIKEFGDGKAELWILEEEKAETELPSRMILFQGLPKADKMEWIVQKSVELGVSEIVPVAMGRCVVKLDEKKAAKKVQRWNAIAESAAKQSGRAMVPVVQNVMHMQEAMEYASQTDVVLIPYELAKNMEETRKVISAINKGQSIAVFIGPEGGFETEEVEAVLEKGGHAITLGKRILRTETAGLTMLSLLMYHLEQ